MDNDKLIAGVSPGGFQDVYMVRILICYLLNAIEQPLSKQQIIYIFEENNLVNYFAFSTAIAQLIDSNHVSVEKNDSNDDFYTLKEDGIKTATVLKHSIPRSVREKVVTCMKNYLSQIKKETENEVTIHPCNNGYMVKFLIHDNDFDLMDLKLYVPNKLQAKKVRSNFWKDPASFYNKMINMLIDD